MKQGKKKFISLQKLFLPFSKEFVHKVSTSHENAIIQNEKPQRAAKWKFACSALVIIGSE